MRWMRYFNPRSRARTIWQRFIWVVNEHTRTLPDFIIIGVQRAGTTSLYNYLVQHPQVIPARKKEVHYFDNRFHNGIGWYKGFFPLRFGAASRSISGEATPYYIFHPLSAERVAQTVPEARLIVLLRNPVDRAYSHYHHEVKTGFENLSFEEAIDREPERLAGERERLIQGGVYYSMPYQHYSYLARGIYADQLCHWFSFFPREQFLILSSEQFYAATPQVLSRVFAFLGLPDYPLSVYTKYNQAQYENMNPATRARLEAYFAPHNRALADLLNEDFGWDA